jgi:hypothetical protein
MTRNSQFDDRIDYELSVSYSGKRRANFIERSEVDALGYGTTGRELVKVESVRVDYKLYDYNWRFDDKERRGFVIKGIETLEDRGREIESWSPVAYVEPKHSVESFQAHLESALSDALEGWVDEDTLGEQVPQIADELIGADIVDHYPEQGESRN